MTKIYGPLIKKLIVEGKTYREIIEATGTCKATISYHKRRLNLNENEDVRIKNAEELVLQGKTTGEIRKVTSLSLASIYKIRHRLNIPNPADPLANPAKAGDYDWSAIQAYHDLGNHLTACQIKFGFSTGSWHKARLRGDLIVRPKWPTLEALLVENSTYNRGDLKRRLIADGLLPNECAVCRQPPLWQGQKLVLALDHKNGVRDDNRLTNLRLVCPNCHSQTETFAGRNKRLCGS